MNMLLVLMYLLMKVSMDVIFALIIAPRGKKLNNLFSVTFRGTQASSVYWKTTQLKMPFFWE